VRTLLALAQRRRLQPLRKYQATRERRQRGRYLPGVLDRGTPPHHLLVVRQDTATRRCH